MKNTATNAGFTLDDLKRFNDQGAEYWLAREVQHALGYAGWRSFRRVIEKAKRACAIAGMDASLHFAEVTTGDRRKRRDVALSRYASYLVIQNASPHKPVVAQCQTYIAIQTRRRELQAGAQPRLPTTVAPADYTSRATEYFLETQTDAKVKREGITHAAGRENVRSLVVEKVRDTIEQLSGRITRNQFVPPNRENRNTESVGFGDNSNVMMEKELFNPSRTVKAVITSREDGLFNVSVYKWINEVIPEYSFETDYFWEEIRGNTFADTLEAAVKLAEEELKGYHW